MGDELAILIVTRDSEVTIGSVLSSIREWSSSCFVLDNASTDRTTEIVRSFPGITLICSSDNLGFSEGNNRILEKALAQHASYFLFLNPDAAPAPGAIQTLLETARSHSDFGAFSPKILRAQSDLTPITPRQLDAAGMYFTLNFRHLDRGSGEVDRGQFDNLEPCSGGTGAALLVSRSFVEGVSMRSTDGRLELFDERFFAYREDAELALRAQRFGFRYLYIPDALFFHIRRVIPDRRGDLPPFLNALSIRNRALLLISHFSISLGFEVILRTTWRNILAFGYALAFEPLSRKLLVRTGIDLFRHLDRRREIAGRTKISIREYRNIFER